MHERNLQGTLCGFLKRLFIYHSTLRGYHIMVKNNKLHFSESDVHPIRMKKCKENCEFTV